MKDEDRVSRATINNILWDVKENNPNEEDVKRVLEYFCNLFDEGELPPIELMQFLRDGIRRRLDEGVPSLDHALGLKRGKGRPPVDRLERVEIAAAFLSCRLRGMTWDEACEKAWPKSKTVVEEAWRDHKGEALVFLRVNQYLDGSSFSEEEQTRIEEIYRGPSEELESVFSGENRTTVSPEK